MSNSIGWRCNKCNQNCGYKNQPNGQCAMFYYWAPVVRQFGAWEVILYPMHQQPFILRHKPQIDYPHCFVWERIPAYICFERKDWRISTFTYYLAILIWFFMRQWHSWLQSRNQYRAEENK
jgi:hypothetical protein